MCDESELSSLDEKYEKFLLTPSSHPRYNDEYEKWWLNKGEELISQGILRYNRDDYNEEWLKFWKSRLQHWKTLELDIRKTGMDLKHENMSQGQSMSSLTRSRNFSIDSVNSVNQSRRFRYVEDEKNKFLTICRFISPISGLIDTQLQPQFHEYFFRNAKASLGNTTMSKEMITENLLFLTMIKEHLIGYLVYDKLEIDRIDDKRKVQFASNKIQQLIESVKTDLES